MPSLSSVLGYPDDGAEPVVPPTRQQTVQLLLSQLADIDQALQEALQDSMAVQVGDLKLNYSAHIAQLYGEGDRLLKTLSALVNLPILYNRYTRTGSGQSSYSIRSYW